LLTGERGHYDIAAARDAGPYLRALEKFSQGIGLIPEQVWDTPNPPTRHLRFGGPTGSALPLLWAHAEYVKLQRSAADGKVFGAATEDSSRMLSALSHAALMSAEPMGGPLSSARSCPTDGASLSDSTNISLNCCKSDVRICVMNRS
jgi:hypothetical protein